MDESQTTQVVEERSAQTTPNGAVDTKKTTVSSVPAGDVGAFKAANLVYFIFGILEALLAFRFVFKLLGANPGSAFVSFIYSLTSVFLAPFTGVFSSASTTGAETTAVFEPATLIAMFVYWLLAWGIVKVVAIASTPNK